MKKLMKKLSTCFLIFIVCYMLNGCLGACMLIDSFNTPEDELIGTWVSTDGKMTCTFSKNQGEYNADLDFTDADYYMNYDISEDSIEFSLNGEELITMDYSLSQDGETLTIDGVVLRKQ